MTTENLEEDVRILSCTTSHRVLRIQSILSEILKGLLINKFSKIFVIENFDLLHFM